jgi:uncharacterized protein (TIGR02001 family)
MQKTKLVLALIATLSAVTAMAADAPAPAPAVTANVSFTTDYVFNGISQNFRTPALQGGFDYVHASGAYLGVWASNISGNQYTNASLETDMYSGYNGKVNDDLAYQVGLLYVTYPGGKTADPATSVYKKWDTTQAIVGTTFKGVNIKVTYTLTDWYGINNSGFTPTMLADSSSTADSAATDLGSKGSTYFEANYSFDLGNDLSLALHGGHQKIVNFSKLDYTDYKIAISKLYQGFTYGLAITTTNATDNTLYHVKANGDDKVLSGNIVAASVSRTF